MPIESAIIPAPRNVEYEWMSIARWKSMHEENKAVAAKGGARLVFVGDSLTELWRWDETWKAFDKYNAANLGIGGDKTQNLLWRLDHGEVGALDPEAVVLLIGTNNFGHLDHSAEEVFEGTRRIVEKLLQVFPRAKLLLMGVFPCQQEADHPFRERIKKTNARTAALADGDRIRFLDIGKELLESDGSISQTIMEDYLHLTPKGYRIWFEAVNPVIEDWLN